MGDRKNVFYKIIPCFNYIYKYPLFLFSETNRKKVDGANEQEILRGVNQKDLKAWETLYASYYAALCSYADGIVKDSDTAQDIVQDTLIRIWNSDRTFPDIKELTWYLYRSTYNNALFYLRTQASRRIFYVRW